MAKALVLGNSHVASVKVAYDQNRALFGDIAFFGATGMDLAFTDVRGGRIVGTDRACLDMATLKQFSLRQGYILTTSASLTSPGSSAIWLPTGWIASIRSAM